MIYEFTIPRVSESLNTLKKILYKQPYKYKQIKETWGEELLPYKVRAGKAKGMRKITIISYRRQICDHDGFIGGLKPLFDALKIAGMIIDDDDKWLVHGDHAQVRSTIQSTKITIEYLY